MNKYTLAIDELYHHGILGQRWGVRRYQNPDGSLTNAGRRRLLREEAKSQKKDLKWAKKNADKITQRVQKKTNKEMSSYVKEMLKNPSSYNTSGKLSAATINAYNKRLAVLMNEKVSDLRSPSGKVIRFVAKRSEVGVMMAMADQGYNMEQIKNGVYSSGKVAYKKTVLDKI